MQLAERFFSQMKRSSGGSAEAEQLLQEDTAASRSTFSSIPYTPVQSVECEPSSEKGSPRARRGSGQPTVADSSDVVIQNDGTSTTLHKEQVYGWLNTCPPTEAEWVIQELAKNNVVCHASMLQAVSPNSHPIAKVEDVNAPMKRQMGRCDLSKPSENEAGAQPIVQFAAFTNFTSEDDMEAVLEVMRIGRLDCKSQVTYRTSDASAKAGKDYVETVGTLTFLPGDSMRSFRVPLLTNEVWNCTVQFNCELSDPENATLPSHLKHALVKILDTDCFPTNKYADLIQSDRIDQIDGFGLLVEYIKMNFRDPTVKRGTIKMLAVANLHNLYYFMTLFLNIYLVDTVLKPGGTSFQDQWTELMLVAGLLTFPYLLLHYLDYQQFTWKVSGMSRKILQGGLLRRFLDLEQAARNEVREGSLIMQITRDSETLVIDGYVNTIHLGALLGKIMLSVAFQCVAPLVLDVKFKWMSFLLLCAYPPAVWAFVTVRAIQTTTALNERNRCQNMVVDTVDETVMNYQLIANYYQRETAIRNFQQNIDDYNKAWVNSALVVLNNTYCAHWLTILFTGCYTIFGGYQVLTDILSLGVFLNNLQMIKMAGANWSQIYAIVLQMQETWPGLRRVVKYLNMPTDLVHRMHRAHDNLVECKRLVKSDPNPDHYPIILRHVAFKWNPELPFSRLNYTGDLQINQGEMTVLVGPPGHGKSTLLRLVGGMMYPNHFSSGSEETPLLFMPPHLTLVHADFAPLFISGSLYKNLTYGVDKTTDDGNEERVRQICSDLGLSERLMSHLHDDDLFDNWGDVLSQSQMFNISLARAFIANPEVICLHKPLMPFGEHAGERILRLLKVFLSQRGLRLKGESHLRRPRTCIMTSQRETSLHFADRIFHVSRAGIKEINCGQAEVRMYREQLSMNLRSEENPAEDPLVAPLSWRSADTIDLMGGKGPTTYVPFGSRSLI